MSSSSSPLPFLPLEVKHHILRFCDPSTLAKTAQVSLAFLELSSPILYEDVHIQGLGALERLFSKRTQPARLQIAPFLSLSQIRDLFIHYRLEDFEEDHYLDLLLDRAPSNSPLTVQTLKIFIAKPSDDHAHHSLELTHLGPFLNPRHLVVEAPWNAGARVLLGDASFSSLETIVLSSVRVGEVALGTTASEAGWNLRRVTFDLPGGHNEHFGDLMSSLLDDLPLPEPSEVLVLVESGADRGAVLATLREDVKRRDSESRKMVLAQVKVEVRERTY